MNKVYDNFSMGNNSEYCNAILDASSKMGKTCAQFLGGQYITLPITAKPRNAITVNMWVYKTSWTVSAREDFIACQQSGGYGLFVNATPNICWDVYDANASAYKAIKVSAANLSSGWHMLTGTFDGSNLKLYIDGVLKGTLASTTNYIKYHASNNVLLGAQVGSGSTPDSSTPHYFNGKIDDVKIYATALSAEDIQKEYKSRATITDRGQLFVKCIDENQGNLIADSSFENIVPTSINGSVYKTDSITPHSGKYCLKYDKQQGLSEAYATIGSAKITAGHKYYFSIWAKSPGSSGALDLYWNIAEPYLGRATFDGRNEWQLISFISRQEWVATGWSGVNNIRLDWDYTSSASGYCYYDDIKLIDITEMFGAGNEPTKEVCDRIFNNSEQLVNEKGICEPTNNICEMGRAMRYLKVSMNGSNENSANHIKRLSYVTVDSKQVEILDATDSVDVKVGSIVQGTMGHSNYTPGGDDGPHSYSYYDVSSPMVFDLGSTNIIAYINLTRYSDDGRYYYGTKLEGSLDNVNWFTIWDSGNTGSYGSDNQFNTYIETAAGRNFLVDCEKAQIVNGTIIASQFIEE